MDKVSHVHEALKPIGLSVTHIVRPPNLPGLSFHFYDMRPSLYGDGKVKRRECNCRVEIWTTNGESKEFPEKIRQSMRKAGFRPTVEGHEIERYAGVYSEALTFYIEYEAEE